MVEVINKKEFEYSLSHVCLLLLLSEALKHVSAVNSHLTVCANVYVVNLNVCAITVSARAPLCGYVYYVGMNKKIGGRGRTMWRSPVHRSCIIHSSALSHSLCCVH